ncbi:uncharacterized protein BJ171DRAFT_637905 [Polychytrium aggregatum]|uniref:uncharacterized protein n=1 Tax=Polychytrium aggregatum TaxID=110093 RepID=UPI0022FE781F|nr:uncharacterized protein BJ171DRAFT_637905 [Polychytrium aggregatum]KAI9193332.1 hypothetical protein BJ171DRAFT_637905 [Polychytrium aggregatum]
MVWNRANGVGQTLMENWVEERAVGEKIVEERENMARVSKMGHSGILTHGSTAFPKATSYTDTFTASHRDASKHSVGKRRQMLEAELMKQALDEMKEPPIDRSAKDWLSTNHSDYSHMDYYEPVRDLGSVRPSQEELQKHDMPVTFWSDHAVRGHGTVICSTTSKQLTNLGIPVGDEHLCAIKRFGRHTAFTTPIEEFKGGPTKML